MIIIPAVDVRQGRCVRLLQGRADAQTIYGDDPSQMAAKWESMGAQRLHVVDLDGAFTKSPQNFSAIEKIVKTIKIPVQVGGGIRDAETIRRFLDIGVSWVIIGTKTIRDPDMVRRAAMDNPNKLILGIDARNGLVAVEGWTEDTAVSALDLARSFEDCPIAAINFTDIARDGMQTGVNIAATRDFAQGTRIPVVASGGVSTLADVEAVLSIEDSGVMGVITGRALYEGTLDLAEAVALTKKNPKA